MLVAPARDNYQYHHRPQQVFPTEKAMRSRPRPRKRRKEGRIELFLVGAILIAAATGMLLTVRATSVVARGYELNQLKREVEEMRKGAGRLQLEVSRLSSLERVEKIAISDLGMRKPLNTEWEVIPGNVTDGRVAVAAAAAANRPPEKVSAESVQKPARGTMGRILARLFGGAGRVEASAY